MAESFTTRLIQRLQIEQKKNDHGGVFEDIANGYPIGEYKNRRNIVSDITTALPEDVHARMTTLLDEYNAADKHDLHGLAKFHADYEAIHPFQDGNGRTGRLILSEKRYYPLCGKCQPQSRILSCVEYRADKTGLQPA